MKDSRVEAALAWLRDLPERERRRVAAGPFDAIAVLILAGMHTEAHMVYSVAHMQIESAFLTLQGVADARSVEAARVLDREPRRLCEPEFKVGPPEDDGPYACGRLCVLVNQGPCGCRVPDRVAVLRRRQRALLWACEAMMRPERKETPCRKSP